MSVTNPLSASNDQTMRWFHLNQASASWLVIHFSEQNPRMLAITSILRRDQSSQFRSLVQAQEHMFRKIRVRQTLELDSRIETAMFKGQDYVTTSISRPATTPQSRWQITRTTCSTPLAKAHPLEARIVPRAGNTTLNCTWRFTGMYTLSLMSGPKGQNQVLGFWHKATPQAMDCMATL